VTFVEHDPADGALREALHATRPTHAMRLENIDRNIARLRRRTVGRVVAGVAVVVAAVVFVGSALSPRSAPQSLRVRPPKNTVPRAKLIPTTLPAAPVSGPKSQRSRVGTPSPTTVQPQLRTVPPAPTTTPHDSVAPTPTTTRDQSPPSTVTVPTTTPLPVGPPLPAGHTRITVILDDKGLHAPATFAAGDHVEILFLDQRSQHGYLSWLIDNGGPRVVRWDGKVQTLSSWRLKPGTTLEFHVDDEQCACTLPGISVTISFT
jgi:hypothetical protein